MFTIEYAARSHRGNVRSNNEDNFFVCGFVRADVNADEISTTGVTQDRMALFAVSDGMGGEEYGERASLMMVQKIYPCGIEAFYDEVEKSVDEANRDVCRMMDAEHVRSGATLVELCLDNGAFAAANIGDSRLYILRDGRLIQLSRDHTVAQMLVEKGEMTPQEALLHKGRHQLTQHIGIYPDETVLTPRFLKKEALQTEDRFLLCSDGLTESISEEIICSILSGELSARQMVDTLIAEALQAGGRDNVTVVVVKVR